MGRTEALLLFGLQLEGLIMADLKVLNAGIKRSEVPDGWTPDRRFIDYRYPKRNEASNTANQSRQSEAASGSSVRQAAETLNKRK